MKDDMIEEEPKDGEDKMVMDKAMPAPSISPENITKLQELAQGIIAILGGGPIAPSAPIKPEEEDMASKMMMGGMK